MAKHARADQESRERRYVQAHVLLQSARDELQHARWALARGDFEAVGVHTRNGLNEVSGARYLAKKYLAKRPATLHPFARKVRLGMVRDLLRLLRKWTRPAREGRSWTWCIVCRTPISAERERRRQHTCSDECQQWYKKLLRAISAARFCRWCGRGRKPPGAVRRPQGRPDGVSRPKPAANAKATAGSGRYDRVKSLGMQPGREEDEDEKAKSLSTTAIPGAVAYAWYCGI